MAEIQERRSSGQLPAEVTGFVGRAAELTQLTDLIGSDARLVTVTGPGGVGKTRLALRAAAGITSGFPGGVYLIELSGLRDPGLLAHTVATGLGLPEQDARSQVDAVLDFLRARGILLILDTCEHLLDACALLADLVLREAPDVTVLATSRQPLDVPGEHVLPVAPLRVTDEGGEALDLFAQRAAAAVAGFALTSANRRQAVALCRRLDGIPLAIELAAVRLRALPLEQLIGRLEDRFRVLTGGNRTVPRHQTLRTAIEWSYGLCTPAEQLLWERLAVFAGPFDADAIEDVCADERLHREDVIDALIGLVDKSVVLRSDEDGGRYWLLDTLREFGAERLAASGSRAAFRARHVARYVRMAGYFSEHLLDDDQVPRFRALTREHANLRAALEYALTHEGGSAPVWLAQGAELATALYGYWQISGLLSEGGYWLSKVLDSFPEPSPERAWALIVRGFLRTLQGEIAGATDDLEQGTPMAEALGERRIAARGHLYLNLVYLFAGRFETAAAEGEEAERRLTALDDHIGLCKLDLHMAYLCQLTGRFEQCVERASAALARLARAPGERWQRGYLHWMSALALLHMPDRRDECGAMAIMSLREKRDLDDRVGIAYAFELLAWLAAGQRDERAAWLLGAADPLWQHTGGRLSNAAAMEQRHQHAERTARETLGDERFGVLWARGAAEPLDRVVAHAIGDADELRPVVRSRSGRRDPLTSREREIAALVAEGLSNREIAARLVVSKRTIDAHVEHIFAKIGISSRVQLVTWLRDTGTPVA